MNTSDGMSEPGGDDALPPRDVSRLRSYRRRYFAAAARNIVNRHRLLVSGGLNLVHTTRTHEFEVVDEDGRLAAFGTYAREPDVT